MNHSRLMIVNDYNRPHELLLLGLSVITGASYLFGTPPPGSITALMPKWQIIIWSIGLLVSGCFGLFGCLYKQNIELSLTIEGSSMLIGAGSLLIPAVFSLTIGGSRAFLAAGTSAAWLLANLWRALQIRQNLKQIRTHYE